MFASGISFSQSGALLTEGQIEFEKKINLYAVNGITNPDIKRVAEQFRTTHFSLRFNRNLTKYIPAPANLLLERAAQPAENNTVYTELNTKKYQSKKTIFEENFTVQDDLPKISWKITGEKKTIAGFVCRRANAIIFDSVYVVAFYADNIAASAGPELFNGLPGMILGVSLPHFHINWFATKISYQKFNDPDLAMPEAKQFVTSEQLKNQLIKDLPSRGSLWNYFLVQSLL
jgi:GLPGLI family protein